MEPEQVLHELQSAILNHSVPFTKYQQYAVQKMTLCRTLPKGGQIGQCSVCGAQEVLYNPCNQRGCPICYQKNQIQWQQKIVDKIVRDSHYHLIFSLPKELTSVWLENKKEFVNLFFKSINTSFKTIEKKSGLLHGITLVFQSHGRGLSYKPHMHCLITQKGLDRAGIWVLGKSIDSSSLLEEFKNNFCKLSKKSFPDHCLENAFKSNDWRIYTELHNHTGKHIINYLSHSILGVVLDFDNIEIDHDKDEVLITESSRSEKIVTKLKISTFVERYINHIPDKGTVVIRHYGMYSTRREKELSKIKEENYEKVKCDSKEEDVETCSLCNSRLQIKQTFKAGQYPDIIKKFIEIHGRPPRHGEVIKL